jgi:hypothetical protein
MGRTKRTRDAAVPQVVTPAHVAGYDVTEADGHHEQVSTRAEVYQHLSAGAIWAVEQEQLDWFAAGVTAESVERHRQLGGV